MTTIKERPLRDDLPFGARIDGVTQEVLKDEGVRKHLYDLFEDRGVLVFERMAQTSAMQVALSNVFGPPQEHSMKAMQRVDQEMMPGVVDINYESCIYEIDGKILCGWLPWHFDACYAAALNRGGVLRVIDLPGQGGQTGFADGIQLYNAISPELRAKVETLRVIYHEKLMFMNQRFGMPKSYRVISLSQNRLDVLAAAESARRAIHPIVWTRRSGEKVLHVAPWQAAGIHGHEDPAGDALLEALFQEIYAKMRPYFHDWKPDDMIVWDNWRFLHSVTGNDPKYTRRVHRTTIKGDYGLGRFEDDIRGEAT